MLQQKKSTSVSEIWMSGMPKSAHPERTCTTSCLLKIGSIQFNSFELIYGVFTTENEIAVENMDRKSCGST